MFELFGADKLVEVSTQSVNDLARSLVLGQVHVSKRSDRRDDVEYRPQPDAAVDCIELFAVLFEQLRPNNVILGRKPKSLLKKQTSPDFMAGDDEAAPIGQPDLLKDRQFAHQAVPRHHAVLKQCQP